MNMTKEDERLADQSGMAIELSADEVSMFEKIEKMQRIHNALGEFLGAYRDRITTLRNEFVQRITHRYNVEKPSLVTFDPISKKLVSIFHPNLKGIKIEHEASTFRRIASDSITGTIRTLTDFLNAGGK